MAFDIIPFRHVSQAFDPIFRQQDPQGPGAHYLPEVHADFRHQLTAPLLLGNDVKLLIAGQPGCGKTSLLLDVAREFRGKGRLVVFVNLELATAVQELGPAEMHLAVLGEVLHESVRSQRMVPDPILNRCRQWLKDLTDTDNRAAGPALLAQRIQSFLSTARDSSALRQALRILVSEGGDKDPLALLSALLREMAESEPVVILDGLDKLPPEQARLFFLDEKRKPMVEAPGSAILTIPLSVVYEPTFNNLSERYLNAHNAVLPAVRIQSLDSKSNHPTRFAAGWDVLRKIVHTRIDQVSPDFMEPDAVDLAIESSGGNLRELARLIQASLVKAMVHESPHIARHHVEEAITDQRESFGRVYQDRFLPALLRVRDEHRLDNVDDIGKMLLYGLWVVEYRNGSVWYDLPLPVRRLVASREGRGG